MVIIVIHLKILFCQRQSTGLPAIDAITFWSVYDDVGVECSVLLEWSVLYINDHFHPAAIALLNLSFHQPRIVCANIITRRINVKSFISNTL